MCKKTSEFTKEQFQIIEQINVAISLLGGKSDILGTIASWGDTIDDNEVLESLKCWNESTAKEQSERMSLFNRCKNR